MDDLGHFYPTTCGTGTAAYQHNNKQNGLGSNTPQSKVSRRKPGCILKA